MNTNTNIENKNTYGAQPHRVHNLIGWSIGFFRLVRGWGAGFIDLNWSSPPFFDFFALTICNFLIHQIPILQRVYYVPGCADPPPVRRTLYKYVHCTDVDNISAYCTSCLFAKNVAYNFLSYSNY